MRKLSKKISMLMVLAMLVSLFSGIVSASAASKWSFYDRTADEVVEVKDTYVMEKDQYANFDLYCEGEEADADTYSYYWESSDPDVVFVDKTNGRLRADKYGKAEAGDKAMISVYIDNKTTKKNENAKRSFYIEIAADEVVEEPEEIVYKVVTTIGDAVLGAETLVADKDYALTSVVTADGEAVEAVVTYTLDGAAIEKLNVKEGEYTVVVTATIDDEVVATEKYAIEVDNFNEFEVEQISAKAFTMTFAEGKDLSKVSKDDLYVGSAATADGTLYREYVGSIKVEKNVITVNLYNEMAKDTYITVKFADEAAGFKVSKGDVDQVVVASGPVMIGEARKLNIKLYSNGIDVTNDALLEYVTLDIVSGGENANVVNGNQIIFWEAGKTATVKATFHTYDYATNGNGTERVYTSEAATITSRTTSVSIGNITEWTLTDQANWWDIKWNGKNFVTLGDNSFRVVGKLTQTTTTTYDDPQSKRTDELGARLAYDSSNTDVFYVDSTGHIYPIKEGTADVIVKDTANNNVIIGVYSVTVKPSRKLVAITASLASKSLISQYEKVVVAVDGKDQYGDGIGTGALTFTNVADNNIALAFTPVPNSNKYELTNAAALATANGKTYTCEIKSGDKKAYVNFTVKLADGNVDQYKYGFDAESYTLSTKVSDQTNEFSKNIKIATYDKNGLLAQTTGTVPVKKILENANQTTANESVTAGAYYVVVDKPWNAAADTVTLADGVISFNYLVKNDNVGQIDKAVAGSYTLKLYKANVIAGDKIGFTLIDTLPITVNNDQPNFVASVKATKADVDFDAIGNELTSKTVGANIKTILDTCYDLKLGNDTYKFAGLNYKEGTLNAIAVDPNLSIKEVQVWQSIKIKDGTSYNVLMTISLYNQSITLK